MKAEEVINKLVVEGNVVKLPDVQLDREEYNKIKKILEDIGGKWKGGKVSGFVFNNDPTVLINNAKNGEKRNLKKETQFYATPENVASELAFYLNVKEGNTILEPSGGEGALIKAVFGEYDFVKSIHTYEIDEYRRNVLNNIAGAIVMGNDFITDHKPDLLYDRIIANPPFAKNQDIDHVNLMYSLLKTNGILVTIVSNHYHHCNFKKETAFRKWLETIEAETYPLGNETFKQSGANVAATILVISK